MCVKADIARNGSNHAAFNRPTPSDARPLCTNAIAFANGGSPASSATAPHHWILHFDMSRFAKAGLSFAIRSAGSNPPPAWRRIRRDE
jgi:hypothetical protein